MKVCDTWLNYDDPFSSTKKNGKTKALSGFGIVEGCGLTSSGGKVFVEAGRVLHRLTGELVSFDRQTLGIPNTSPATTRHDLIVVERDAAEAVNSTSAKVRIVEGGEGYNNPASNQTLIAYAELLSGGSYYTSFFYVTLNGHIANYVSDGVSGDDTVSVASAPIFKELFAIGTRTATDMPSGAKQCWVQLSDTYDNDGDDITWGDPQHEIANTQKHWLPTALGVRYSGTYEKGDYIIDSNRVFNKFSSTGTRSEAWTFKLPKGRYEIEAIKVFYDTRDAGTGDVVITAATGRHRDDATTVSVQDPNRVYSVGSAGAYKTDVLSVNSAAWAGQTFQDGDILGISIQRAGGHASDNYSGDWYVYGVELTLKVA